MPKEETKDWDSSSSESESSFDSLASQLSPESGIEKNVINDEQPRLVEPSDEERKSDKIGVLGASTTELFIDEEEIYELNEQSQQMQNEERIEQNWKSVIDKLDIDSCFQKINMAGRKEGLEKLINRGEGLLKALYTYCISKFEMDNPSKIKQELAELRNELSEIEFIYKKLSLERKGEAKSLIPLCMNFHNKLRQVSIFTEF